MKGFKRLKDPIYGYISIPVDYMTDIIDTPCFQRLRRIIQTSYSPLYSSAVHNRFVHSMGVYHLGEIAFRQLNDEFQNKDELKSVGESFLLACLLHDVGHAPFSHTGESFYLAENNSYQDLHNELVSEIENKGFIKDIPAGSNAAAPHEIMSAIVAIKQYGNFFQDNDQKEFFARCITGYKFTEKTKLNSLKNCFISLLNSKVIDVDKLDYLIRDAYVTGFDTISIDYERLLTSLVVKEVDGEYELAYHKNAISVIENVVYAHDAERKWIQSHPVVQYEAYLLHHMIAILSESLKSGDKRLFSYDSLSEKGQILKDNLNVKLLCDDDVIFLIKSKYYGDLSREYFDRRIRRHPIWKSEAEYKAFILSETSGGRILEEFESAMEEISINLMKTGGLRVINEAFSAKIKEEVSMLNDPKVINSPNFDECSVKKQKKSKEDILKVINCLENYAKEKKLGKKTDFVILQTSQFDSGFGKNDFPEIKIVFQIGEDDYQIRKVGDIVSSLEAKKRERDNFFYIFYKRENEEVKINNQELCRRLVGCFV